MTLRDKVSNLFGFRLVETEPYASYLARMDKAGQCDQVKLLKLIIICLETLDGMGTESVPKDATRV